jgi:hypothetical protein
VITIKLVSFKYNTVTIPEHLPVEKYDDPISSALASWVARKSVPRANLLSCLSMLLERKIGPFTLYISLILSVFLLFSPSSPAQDATAPSASRPSAKNNAEFLATADEVLQEMSEITGWKLKSPLKKSIRSREDIHAYVLQQMNDDKDAKERYASTRTAEAFGLIPKGFDLEGFLVDLLTEQIAGLYDPKAHEFYIADWISPEDQRMVMSHELTHALEDQHFDIEPWVKAARPNDDAELARESVLEGSAMAAMLDYMLKDKGLKLKDLPDIDPTVLVGDLSETPLLKKAPPFIKDSLMFPYFGGLTFSANILKTDGWSGFASVFTKPPANTQQIMHPALYRAGKVPPPLSLGFPENQLTAKWTKLETNSLGEFGWKEVLKQFLDDDRAKQLSVGWDGDVYATFENKDAKRTLLVTHLRLADEDFTKRFFEQYSVLLETKYPQRSNLVRQSDYRSFSSPDGGVFLRCVGKECITLEGGDAALFLKWSSALGWPQSTAGSTPTH